MLQIDGGVVETEGHNTFQFLFDERNTSIFEVDLIKFA